MNTEKFIHIVTEEDIEMKRTLIDLMRVHFNFSSRLRKKIKANKGLRLNGEEVPGWVSGKVGDIFTVIIPEDRNHIPAQNIPIDIAYEDDYLLIVNKNPGIVVHPTKGHPDNTLANGLVHYIEQSRQNFKLRFINRLDFDTSGLLLIAKNAHVQARMSKFMSSNLIKKKYLALVSGDIEESCGEINLPIGRPSAEDVRRKVMESGAKSVTCFKLIQNLKSACLLELLLKTGRTHQIRVHMSHIGHPILQDDLYGYMNPVLPINRQALHAANLAFPHPITDKFIEVESPLPKDMADTIAFLS